MEKKQSKTDEVLFIYQKNDEIIDKLIKLIDEKYEKKANLKNIDGIRTYCVEIIKESKKTKYMQVNKKQEEIILKNKHVQISELPVLLQLQDSKVIATYYIKDLTIDEIELFC